MERFYEATAVKRDGKVTVDDPARMMQALKHWPDGTLVVRLEPFKMKRSNQQNRFWHGVVIPAFMEQTGEDVHDDEAFQRMKDALALRLIPKQIIDLNGEAQTVPGHTSDLTTAQFKDLIERAQRLGAEYGVYVPDPNEYYQGAA